MKKSLKLSVVVPVYNEYENIPVLNEHILQALNDKVSFEIIYIDDGSDDGSSRRLDRIQEENKDKVRVFHFTENSGQTAAFAAGFKKAAGELVATLDADLQVEPEDIFKLLPYIDTYDVVAGVREKRQDSFVKKVSSLIGNSVRNWLTGEDIQDTGCPLKLFRAEVVKSLYLYSGMHRFLPTLARMNGYSVKEIPVSHYPRKYGESKYGINNRMWSGLKDTLAVRWMQKRMLNYRIREEEK